MLRSKAIFSSRFIKFTSFQIFNFSLLQQLQGKLPPSEVALHFFSFLKGYWAYALRDCTLTLLEPSGYEIPVLAAIPVIYDDTIRINVEFGSIPADHWEYSVSSTEGIYSWTTGTENLIRRTSLWELLRKEPIT